MNKYFYALLTTIVFSFFSCIKEYQVFYPYKNTGLSYLSQIQPSTKILKFDNDSIFTYKSKMGFTVTLNKNSFENVTGKVNLHLENLGTAGEFISNRISFEEKNKKLISGYKIISFLFTDDIGNILKIKNGSFIEFKIPYNYIKTPSIYKFHNEKWIKEFINNDDFQKTTWEVITGEGTILQKGYKFKTNNEGQYCLGTEIENESIIDKFNIALPNGFDVNNSIVQIYYTKLNTNIELFWDGESKTFQLPQGLKVPNQEGIIIVLSENAELQPFFGIKSAILKQGDFINIDVNKKTLEEVKNVLNNL